MHFKCWGIHNTQGNVGTVGIHPKMAFRRWYCAFVGAFYVYIIYDILKKSLFRCLCLTNVWVTIEIHIRYNHETKQFGKILFQEVELLTFVITNLLQWPNHPIMPESCTNDNNLSHFCILFGPISSGLHVVSVSMMAGLLLATSHICSQSSSLVVSHIATKSTSVVVEIGSV